MKSLFSWGFAITFAPLSMLVIACGHKNAISPQEVARTEFSNAHYCPVERVGAETLSPVPPAPSAIANDPERMEMWTRIQLAHHRPREPVGGYGAEAAIVDARGCGEEARYACTVLGGQVPTRRGSRYVDWASVCIERQ